MPKQFKISLFDAFKAATAGQRENSEPDFLTFNTKNEKNKRIFMIYNGQALQEFVRKGTANERATSLVKLWRDRLPLTSVSSVFSNQKVGNYKEALLGGCSVGIC